MKNDIIIEVESSPNNYEPLDLDPKQSITLEWTSNILSSIEDITCSSTYTIEVPHTVTNDRVLQLAKVPSFESNKRYKKIGCRVYVNGIDITGKAWCYITSCKRDTYSIVISFGLMHTLEDWLDNKPGLRDLTQGEYDYIKWFEGSGNNEHSDPVWLSGVSHCYPPSENPYPGAGSIFFGLYDYGVERNNKTISLCNIHPFVNLREIWERITAENNLNFNIPWEFKTDMENNAIVLTKNNNNGIAFETQQIDAVFKPITHGGATDTKRKWFFQMKPEFAEYFNNTKSAFIHKGEGVVSITINTIYLKCVKSGGFTAAFMTDILNNPNDYKLTIIAGGNRTYITPTQGDGEPNIKYIVNQTFTVEASSTGWPIVYMFINCKKLPSFPDDVWEHPWSTPPSNPTWSGGMDAYIYLATNAQLTTQNNFASYSYQQGTTNQYPLVDFELVKNLPDMSQIEYIKAVCQMYGLFAVTNPNDAETVDFVPFTILADNADNGNIYDWSDKHVDTGRDSAEETSFVIGDYSQRNKICYKVDEKEEHPNNSEGFLIVENETLNEEKTIIEFPWAASSGDKITQYKLEGDKAIFIDCEYRLMRVVEWGNEIKLSFTPSLEANSLINSHYAEYQDIIKRPMIITDKILLDEYELKTLDFTKPVYLKKYGRYFAIISVRWSSDRRASEVKLLRL